MDTRRLLRSNNDKMIAGVCGGIAGYLKWDPTLVRLVFVLLFLLGGHGLLVYLVLWILMPPDRVVLQGQVVPPTHES